MCHCMQIRFPFYYSPVFGKGSGAFDGGVRVDDGGGEGRRAGVLAVGAPRDPPLAPGHLQARGELSPRVHVRTRNPFFGLGKV